MQDVSGYPTTVMVILLLRYSSVFEIFQEGTVRTLSVDSAIEVREVMYVLGLVNA